MPLTDDMPELDELETETEEEPEPGAAPAPGRAPRRRRLVIRDHGLRALAEFVCSLEKQTLPERVANIRWLAARYKVTL